MTTMSYDKVVDQIHQIYAMKSIMDVINKQIQVGMSDIDSKARKFLNRATDAQLALLRAKAYLSHNSAVVSSELTQGEVDGD